LTTSCITAYKLPMHSTRQVNNNSPQSLIFLQ
jgi:hypothetical protein